jgi:serine O-acetyltransferase
MWSMSCRPEFTMLEFVRADFRRYCPAGGGPRAGLLALLEYGFLATLIYRYGRWTRLIRPRLLGLPFKLAYWLLARCSDLLFGINISTNASIGPGLYIGHYGGIFLHGDMGPNCSVGQCVTVGYKGAGRSTRPPRIGANVYIGTSAVVIGDIEIGDDVIIGANTTVVVDVPAGHRVVGAAVRISRLEARAPRPKVHPEPGDS